MTSLTDLIDYRYVLQSGKVWLEVMYDKTLELSSGLKSIGWCVVSVDGGSPTSRKIQLRDKNINIDKNDSILEKERSRVFLCDTTKKDFLTLNVRIKLNSGRGNTVYNDTVSLLELALDRDKQKVPR